MDINDHTQPAQLERNSFLWSEVRLVIAAAALFLGGVPPVLYFNLPSGLYGPVTSLLKIAWIVSGFASVYMFWRWNSNGKLLFGGKQPRDTYAFLVSVVSGINLGLTGLIATNIGMSFSSNRVIFAAVGVLYLLAAAHLWKRWNSSGQKIF